MSEFLLRELRSGKTLDYKFTMLRQARSSMQTASSQMYVHHQQVSFKIVSCSHGNNHEVVR